MAKPDACSFVPVGIAEVALGQLTVIAAWLLISPGWQPPDTCNSCAWVKVKHKRPDESRFWKADPAKHSGLW